MNKYAFVLVHFGNNIKYLEYEIYLLLNLKKNTNNDIIYLYSINDTPDKFIKIINKLDIKMIPYDDNNITFNVKFNSVYEHFNILRTCNFIFAYKLLEYKKVCIIESDMIILGNIDSIFNLKTPSMLVYSDNILENYKVINNNFYKFNGNGGVLLIKPSLVYYKKYLKNIEFIIEKKYDYPNESLFLYTNKFFYNLPYKYNSYAKDYELLEIKKKYKIDDLKKYLKILHFKCSTYKHIDIIKDNYLEKLKIKSNLLYYFINKYKKEYYDKYYSKITKLLSDI
jgi:alpha-N-acetylglucosamine transferase